jgi:cell division protein FtsI/penicillin-binding protein 2
MTTWLIAFATCAVMLEATPAITPRTARLPVQAHYLLVDVSTGRLLEARWTNPDSRVPVGSLIKPFIAVAYAQAHGLVYPTSVCHGAADRCWLPSGHGRVGISEAIAQSCNAYFLRLAGRTPPSGLIATLRWFGVTADAASMTPASMVGLGEGVRVSPVALLRGYVELVSRADQPGVVPILSGMRQSGRWGTGRAIGTVMAGADVLVKTGTSPCVHSPKAAGDGYAIVLYPADRPRVALLVQAHGRTGAETAGLAGELLRNDQVR